MSGPTSVRRCSNCSEDIRVNLGNCEKNTFSYKEKNSLPIEELPVVEWKFLYECVISPSIFPLRYISRAHNLRFWRIILCLLRRKNDENKQIYACQKSCSLICRSRPSYMFCISWQRWDNYIRNAVALVVPVVSVAFKYTGRTGTTVKEPIEQMTIKRGEK